MSERRQPGRPVEVDPDALALVALGLFAERGIDGVTMTEVAEAAGLSRRTLFRWFPSKAALVWGGTEEADERFERAWQAAGAAIAAGTADGRAARSNEDRSRELFARVRAAYAASIAPLGESAEITRLRLRLIDANPTVYAWGHELRSGMSARLAEHVAEVLDLPVDSLQVTARVAAMSGASYAALVWWATHDDPRTPAAAVDEALAVLVPVFEG